MGDWHAARKPKKYGARRYQAIDAMLEYGDRKGCELHLLGDMFDERPEDDAVVAEWKWLRKRLQNWMHGMPSMLYGNHDGKHYGRDDVMGDIRRAGLVLVKGKAVATHGHAFGTRRAKHVIKAVEQDGHHGQFDSDEELKRELESLQLLYGWAMWFEHKLDAIGVTNAAEIIDALDAAKVRTATWLWKLFQAAPECMPTQEEVSADLDDYTVQSGYDLAKATGASVSILGHTHRPLMRIIDGVVVVNAGSFMTYDHPTCVMVRDDAVQLLEFHGGTMRVRQEAEIPDAQQVGA